MTRATYFCAALIALSAVGYHAARLSGRAGGPSEPTKLALPLDQLPREMSGWTGRDVPLSDEVIRVAAADAHLNRAYEDGSGTAVSLYIAYYGCVKDRVPHGPTVCYPYQGWREELNEMIAVPSHAAAFPELRARKLVYSKAGARVAVLYWYSANGQQQVGSEWQKFSSALRDLIGQGGAYVFQVMVTTPVVGSTEGAFAPLESFLERSFSAIAMHFPGGRSPNGPGAH